jgi:hypothetical protein
LEPWFFPLFEAGVLNVFKIAIRKLPVKKNLNSFNKALAAKWIHPAQAAGGKTAITWAIFRSPDLPIFQRVSLQTLWPW